MFERDDSYNDGTYLLGVAYCFFSWRILSQFFAKTKTILVHRTPGKLFYWWKHTSKCGNGPYDFYSLCFVKKILY